MEKVKGFLDINSGSGSGDGSGYGDGSGSGYGDGDGDGDGDGSGYGYGYGYGDGISVYNGAIVYMVDGLQTLISSVRGNIASGHILNNDLTLTPCYIFKQDNVFAHGSSVREARGAALEKAFDNMPEKARIEAFVKAHKPGITYPNADFSSWHHRLTGSCKMGREQFAKDHGIDVENGSMTPETFILLTEDAYGGGTIRKLKPYYNLL